MVGSLIILIMCVIPYNILFTRDNNPEPQVIEYDIVLVQPQFRGDMELAGDKMEK